MLDLQELLDSIIIAIIKIIGLIAIILIFKKKVSYYGCTE